MPPGANNFWTPDRVTWLRENARGNSASWLGRQLGCTRNAVIGKAHRLGLELSIPSDKTPDERHAARLEYHRAYYWGHREAQTQAMRARYWGKKGMAPPEYNPKPRPTRPEAPTTPYVPSGGVGLFDLGNHSCRWPITDGRPPYLYCGHVAATGSSYCPHHWHMSRGNSARRWA